MRRSRSVSHSSAAPVIKTRVRGGPERWSKRLAGIKHLIDLREL
nr:hypothetical protein [uncultured bacterium]